MGKSQLECDIAESNVGDHTSAEVTLMQIKATTGIENPQKIIDILDATNGVYAG